jgi:hypothetical protein
MNKIYALAKVGWIEMCIKNKEKAGTSVSS